MVDVLPDTTLCMIVRDEIMNPAGGIARFLEATLPHVEEAVIVDTGSVDGTREALEEATAQHKHLRVYDHPFDGYATSRNKSLKKARTRRVFVLDADEHLTTIDWATLTQEVRRERFPSIVRFDFRGVQTDGKIGRVSAHCERLYDLSLRPIYRAEPVYENIKFREPYEYDQVRWSAAAIYHFELGKEASDLKDLHWYDEVHSKLMERAAVKKARRYKQPIIDAPSQTHGFAAWKAFNPHRDDPRDA